MNIVLIGMSGVGKSFFGKKLSKKMNYYFYDSDLEIKKKLIRDKNDFSIQELLDNLGESKFLEFEEEVLINMKFKEPYIFSPGGSIIYYPKVLKKHKENSLIIHLKPSWQNYLKIVKNPYKRGVVGLKDNFLKKLFYERMVLYDDFSNIILNLDNYISKKNGFLLNKMLRDLEKIISTN